jgi:hypothetical protein
MQQQQQAVMSLFKLYLTGFLIIKWTVEKNVQPYLLKK